ncbi:hypothetical protein [Rhodoferax sp. BAB1]|uniref:hypothetical protein n=1 Tax=Rhodoferax sp. BAB1 TaxID=2741720 RepID=UPI001576DC31|nr:hypothetical protein [Rhodoferax sp. BAB1]QKO21975.1 hypothetical protein HTY51_08770 [Rhodoferax sp. BAB1]
MKFDRNKAFPYPVLRPHCNDYIDVEFQTTVEFVIEKESVTVEVSFATSSDELINEVVAGRAKYVAIVSCRDTYLRAVISSAEPHVSQELGAGVLRGEVKVDTYIVATVAISGFKSSDINPEFGKTEFDFSPGDVLAQDEPQSFFIDRDLFKPVTSIFDLVKNDALSGGEWRVGFEENHIQIEVSGQMKDAVDSARNSKNNQVILLNSIYAAAVTQALQKLKESSSDYEDKRWSAVLRGQLHNAGWDLNATEPYILAQRLMKYPMTLLQTYVFKGEQ